MQEENKQSMSSIQCYHCKKYGHKKAQCWLRGKEINLVEQLEVSNLFMVKSETDIGQGSVWIVESGCSNHLTGERSLFHDLKEVKGQIVKLGDDKELQVARKGSVVINSSSGKISILNEIQYVPSSCT